MRPWSLVRAAALALVFLACDEVLAPSKVDKMHFSIAAGDNQTGNPGGLLPLALKVMVVDDRGRRVKNVDMTFQVASGGGSVLSGATRTNADGIAEERWTVGMGGTQRVEARAVGGPGASIL